MPMPTVRFRDPDTGREVGPEVHPTAGRGRQFVEFGPAVDERKRAALTPPAAPPDKMAKARAARAAKRAAADTTIG